MMRPSSRHERIAFGASVVVGLTIAILLDRVPSLISLGLFALVLLGLLLGKSLVRRREKSLLTDESSSVTPRNGVSADRDGTNDAR
jgi:F0F1-type ATP synthase assembly protein I